MIIQAVFDACSLASTPEVCAAHVATLRGRGIGLDVVAARGDFRLFARRASEAGERVMWNLTPANVADVPALASLSATYGYYVDDTTLGPGTRQLVSWVREVDPGRPVVVGVFTPEQAREYGRPGTTLMPEVYPVTSGPYDPRVTRAFLDEYGSAPRRQAVALQAFAWGSELAPGYCPCRAPTEAEQASIARAVVRRWRPRIVFWYEYSRADWGAVSSVIRSTNWGT